MRRRPGMDTRSRIFEPAQPARHEKTRSLPGGKDRKEGLPVIAPLDDVLWLAPDDVPGETGHDRPFRTMIGADGWYSTLPTK